MKTTRTAAGQYMVTGHTAQGDLVQYEVTKNAHAWVVELVYGKGKALNLCYHSKAEALQAIENQG